MALVLFQTRRVRDVLKAGPSIGVDLLCLAVILAIAMALFSFGREINAPYTPTVPVSLSVWALPKYTMFSLARGFAAYVLSLVFTLIYGSVAAHNHRAEKVMIPLLDVLQSIPVLGFLPAVILTMIALFPARQVGLEVACIILIFTSQVWNMIFSYYSSVRHISPALRDVATINGLSKLQVLRKLEIPASMIGLVWNSMMSMAGGWFVLNVTETFTLKGRSFRLPGIGSYMQEAFNQGNVHAEILAILAMIILIVAVDQFFWRPIVAWSERFKMEETADVDKAQSWVLSMLQHSFVYETLSAWLKRRRAARLATPDGAEPPAAPAPRSGVANGTANAVATQRALPSPEPRLAMSLINWTIVVFLAAVALWGAVRMGELLRQVKLHEWGQLLLALLASLARTTAAVALGCAWCLPAGIIIGLSPRWSQRLQPIVQVLASFPAPMLFPFLTVCLLMVHIPFTVGCVALMLLGTQWYILFNVIAGASGIPGELKEVSRVYNMPRWKRWTRLYIPGVFPQLVTGLVTAAGGAWNATIIAEYVQATQTSQPVVAFGLGSTICEATSSAKFPLLAAAVVVMAAAVVTLNRLGWKRLYRLAEDRYSLNV